MGAGRVGVTLAETLEAKGHSVAIIDQNPEAFRRLSDDFEGRRVTGMGFDREALAQAGIEDAYAFAAVSSGDNSNIIAARVVREVFGIDNVVARIYDPGRAQIYQRLGITTVATVRWTADQVLRRMMPTGAASEYRDASGGVSLCEMDLHEGWIGHTVRQLQNLAQARIAYLTRFGEAYIPAPLDVLQENDVLHVIVYTDRISDVQRVLATAPKPEED
ncbi:TrkA family potassium uptake protein [Occultella glacieicola]|uniref:TrkA family potassium uptake protein n=1 Tax=Occultella glacieicola TaxID=2518684 RepID=A0ABY2DY79_9MICO|nr:TrkA family potassium uptake protein [Occultella glacieicola]TDE88986.1 TrkA family potassium uptake protein [Occultella glacieicola]